jgi:predicted DNA binding CopG/RHH family protein
MARTETLQLRLAPDELEKLRTAAAARGWSMAQLLRELIRQLPEEKPS